MVIEPDVLTGGCDSSSCWSNPGGDGDITPRQIIGDSGAAKDILGQNDLSSDCVINTISEPTKVDTANGLVSSNKEVTYWSQALDETLLEKSVSVLSIGKRCAHQGWSFIWPAWGK
eukprot:12757410-Heterocapsa_arctica.AAC.1